MNLRKTGNEKEQMAALYLKDHGVVILERNFRIRIGEIDIIANDKGVLCFIEVKYRCSEKQGKPYEAVGIKKQRTISMVSDFYRIKANIDIYKAMRFDIISIQGNEITWYKNAFSYCGNAFF